MLGLASIFSLVRGIESLFLYPYKTRPIIGVTLSLISLLCILIPIIRVFHV